MSGFRVPLAGEVFILAICFSVFVCLHLAGRALLGPKAWAPIMPLAGLVTIYSFFVAGSLLIFKFPIEIPFYALLILAFIGLIRNYNHLVVDLGYVFLSILSISPLLFLAAIVNEPQWDDMTHWLPSAQYLFRERHLPTFDIPPINNVVPAYPYSRAILHAWVNSVSGEFTTNVQGIFNCLFMSSTFLWAPYYVKLCLGEDCKVKEKIFLVAASSALVVPWAAVLGSTLIVSSYADPLLAVCFLHIFMIFILVCTQQTHVRDSKILVYAQIIIMFVAAASVKQSGIYLGIIFLALIWLHDALSLQKQEGIFYAHQ